MERGYFKIIIYIIDSKAFAKEKGGAMQAPTTRLPHIVFDSKDAIEVAKDREICVVKNEYGQLIVKLESKSLIHLNKPEKRKATICCYFDDLAERYGRVVTIIVSAWKRIDFVEMYRGNKKGNPFPLIKSHFVRLEKYCERLHSITKYVSIIADSLIQTPISPRGSLKPPDFEEEIEEMTPTRKRSGSFLFNKGLTRAIKQDKKLGNSQSLVAQAFRKYANFFHLLTIGEAVEIHNQLSLATAATSIAMLSAKHTHLPLTQPNANKLINLIDTLALFYKNPKRMIDKDNSEVLASAIKKLEIKDT